MAKRRSGKKKTSAAPVQPEVIGLILLALALLTGLSLVSFSQGSITEQWLRALRDLMGWGMYLAPVILAGMGVWLLRRFATEDLQERWEKPIGALLLFLLLLASFHLISPGAGLANLDQSGGGGLLGWAIGELLVAAIGKPGSVVILIALGIVCLVLVSGLSLAELLAVVRRGIVRISEWRRQRELARISRQPLSPLPENMPRSPNLLQRLFSPGAQTPTATGRSDQPGAPADQPSIVPSEAGTGAQAPGVLFPRVMGAQTWRLPPLESIFEEGLEHEVSQQEIRGRAKIIEETLGSFGIEAKVHEINPGPAVTQFSVDPGYMNTKDAQGRPRKVRVSRIVNLTNDLALALSASPIRIEAPIPGRPYVGIEVPNITRSMVSLRSSMESATFRNAKGPLRFTLGRDVAGEPIVTDLTSMPHLLVAGATGSGKSVCINAIIACLLSMHTPETLRLLMMDPKMVELVNYTGIPHLLAPVVVDVERVIGVLNWVTQEMGRRYKVFSQLGVRNLVGYNELMVSRDESIMPYVVVVIDELADLMMTAPDEMERAITRIAQMARATGIHLIIATQRPSTDVVTGLIKANFPARIAFAATSQIDSRVILDTPGAERLLGRGDMLFMAPDSSKLQRLQGAFVSDPELARLIRYWKEAHTGDETSAGLAQASVSSLRSSLDVGPPVQPMLWPDLDTTRQSAGAKTDEDDLLPKAIEMVRSQQRTSISLLQRRLRIGYARAARLIDLMEEEGIIGPDQGGGRSRQVLLAASDNEM